MADRRAVAAALKQEFFAVHRCGYVDCDHQLQVDRNEPVARLPSRSRRGGKQEHQNERRSTHHHLPRAGQESGATVAAFRP